MTYTHQHTKAHPSLWLGGCIVAEQVTIKGCKVPIWSDLGGELTYERFEAVKVVSLALDKMTK